MGARSSGRATSVDVEQRPRMHGAGSRSSKVRATKRRWKDVAAVDQISGEVVVSHGPCPCVSDLLSIMK